MTYNNCCTPRPNVLYISYNAFKRLGAMKLEIKKIGNSTGLILPKELLARLNLQQGDEVVVTEAPDGFNVSKDNSDFEKAMSIVDDIMVEYRETLQALAK